jgi:hypothetical protein
VIPTIHEVKLFPYFHFSLFRFVFRLLSAVCSARFHVSFVSFRSQACKFNKSRVGGKAFDSLEFQHNHLKLLPSIVWFGFMTLMTGFVFYEKGDLWILGLIGVEIYATLIICSLAVEFRKERSQFNTHETEFV